MTAQGSSTMRRCFVCLSDEDDPDFVSQEWVDPCPCTLAAHQSCILDWVADVERQRRPLQCPICKAPIKLQQPFDLVTWLSDRMYNALSRVSPTALALLFSTTTLAGSASYGLGALVVFAGPHGALRALWIGDPGPWYKRIRWATILHLPLVGPSLVLNKYVRLFGRYSTVPHFLLYTVSKLSPMNPTSHWPPTPWLFMAWYPEVYRIYCKAYRELFGDVERRLDRELRSNNQQQQQPQQGEGDIEGAAGENQALPQPANAEVLGRREDPVPAVAAALAAQPNPAPRQDHQGLVDALLNFFRPDDDRHDEDGQGAGNNRGRPRHRRGFAGAEIPGLNLQIELEEVIEEGLGPADQVAAPDNNANDDDVNNNNNNDNNNNGAAAGGRRAENNIELPPLIDIANSITHSLLLPGIAYTVGEVLKRTILPKSWTASRSPLRATGLLQEQWGRSIVGGCLYVVFRDMFRLYAKYRRVQIKPLRRVKNVDRSKNARNNGGGRAGSS